MKKKISVCRGNSHSCFNLQDKKLYFKENTGVFPFEKVINQNLQ